MPIHPPETTQTATGRWAAEALLLSTIAAMVLLGRLLYLCGAGIDFTDEGYYLNWIAHHDLYAVSATQFGFVYAPLSRILGEDVVLLRQANVLITFGLAYLLFRTFFHSLPQPGAFPLLSARVRNACLAAVLASTSLVFLYQWIPTPSYNSLALQALLLTATGLLLAKRETSVGSHAGWMAIGVGGALAFAAKPTTAALLAVLVGGWLLASRRMNLRLGLLCLAASGAVLGAIAWGADGSLTAFANRLAGGVADVNRLQGGYAPATMFRLPEFQFSPLETSAFWAHVTILIVAGVLSSRAHRAAHAGGAAIVLLLAGLTVAVSLGWLSLRFAPPRFLGLQLLAIPLAAVLTGAFLHRGELRTWLRERSWGLPACLLAFPYAYAFGTNNYYAVSAGWAAVFWVLAGIIFLAGHSGRDTWAAFVPLAAGAQLLAAVLLHVAAEHPYRQTQPLRLASNPVEIRPESSLRVSADFATYLEQLKTLARNAGFQTGDPMIDLTGHYPTSLYALGARPLGLPWLPGGYAGSNDLARAALARVPAPDLRRAWLLTEPDGERALSPAILRQLGLNLERDYVDVGTLDSPTGTYPKSYRQHLLKPVR